MNKIINNNKCVRYYICNNYSEDFLSLWHLYNLKNKTQIKLPIQEQSLNANNEKQLLTESFTNFSLFEDDMKKTVSKLVKELWTVEGEDPHYKPPIQRVNFR